MRGRWGIQAGALAVLALCLLLPVSAWAAEEEYEGAFGAFSLEATNGYEIVAFAFADRTTRKGELLLIVGTDKKGVFYSTKATVTPTSIEADLGALGEIALTYVPLGVKEKVRDCEGDRITLPKAEYRGRFEFRGEEGFATASATRIPADNRVAVNLLCGGAGFVESRGPGLVGARLRVLPRTGKKSALDFEVRKNRPGARALLSIGTQERRDGIAIIRRMETLVGSAAFAYDPLLRTATVDPPAPFEGSATFRRNAEPANRWLGNLAVDLPGRSNVPLAGARFQAQLHPSRWSTF